MKWVRTAIGAVIAISVIPVIILTVVHVTELKDVKNVQFELLSEGDDNFFITSGTYNKLIEYKKIINYDIESNYPLITHEEMERSTWKINDELKNEFTDRDTIPRLNEKVGRLIVDPNDVGRASTQSENNTYRFLIPRSTLESKLDNFYFDINSVVGVNYNWHMYTDDFPHQLVQDDDRRGFEYRSVFGIWIRIEKDIVDSYVGVDVLQKFRNYLQDNPLTIYYELVVKNPNSKVIVNDDLLTTSDYVRMIKPNDFSNNSEGLFVSNLMNYIDSFDITTDYINIYPKNITVTELKNRLVGETLIYELAQPRLAEQYDLSTFKLTFDDNRIRILFDIDEGYYLWEITNDDRLIPINGQHEIGNIWTVKFYVYEIQQPLIRSLVLLIPLIVISGLLYYLYILVSKRE